ncbi:MAG: HAMP domain-containing sensor histidine kinase [Bacteroidia bacterium]
MEIRKKILLYFSLTTILLTGIALFFIYTLFAEYREEEFQQRQKDKIKSTLFFLSEIKKADNELTQAIDKLTINDLYNEKLLIFDFKKELIYTSIDDTPIQYSKNILEELSVNNEWYESKEKLFDVVGLYFKNGNNVYYGISKAYDKFGYAKLNFLKLILLVTFLIISVAVIFISYFLSKKITFSLTNLTKQIGSYNFDNEYTPIEFDQSKDEIIILSKQFNKLMKRMNEVFSFQKHAIHHISHELKTPIAILVSNFEKIEKETDLETIRLLNKNQKEDTKTLSEIINSLLEISKAETGNTLKQNIIRVDELIFDVADELKNIHSDFVFSIAYTEEDDEKKLMLYANVLLLKAAIMNLMVNCIQYSHDKKAKITIKAKANLIEVAFENKGTIIGENEIQFLFEHFFRGENSKGKRGFGLGLVFVHKIITLHGGNVYYHSSNNTSNVFTISIPLS